MRRIHLLSEQTINQIAAGEVIEAPFSVVKELVENALDAGATAIVVEIVDGGLQKIVVSDNGCGMGAEDALLCLQRHATSKIQDAEDLLRISTMGFRGEALPSIASISKMTIRTAIAGEIGMEVEVEGGGEIVSRPCARNPGTTIEVRQLFYNVPARRKFQKSPGTCAAEVTKTVMALALANPRVSFSLYQQDQKILSFISQEEESFLIALEKRVEQVLGKEFITDNIKVDIAGNHWRCIGVLASVQNTRPNKTLQYQCVNGRPVLCPTISYAVKDALGTRIQEGRYPLYVLHLDIDKECMDVNVHPQKREIRLLEERKIKQEIQSCLQDIFSPRVVEGAEPPPLSFLMFPDVFNDFPLEGNLHQEEGVQSVASWMQPTLPLEKRAVPIGLYGQFLWLEASSLSWLENRAEGMVLMDLQAASSCVLFESLKVKGKSSQQELLFPITLACSFLDEIELDASLTQLDEMGFSIEKGRNTLLVNAIPASFSEEEVEVFVRDFLSMEDKVGELEQRRERKLASFCARVASLRAKKHNMATALILLETWEKNGCPARCPLGKKVWVTLNEEDLQQFLGNKKQ